MMATAGVFLSRNQNQERGKIIRHCSTATGAPEDEVRDGSLTFLGFARQKPRRGLLVPELE